MIPPLMIWLHVETPERERQLRLWLPLFLVWLLLLPLWLLALSCTILADLILYIVGARYHRYTLLLLGVSGLLADMRGTVVRVNGERTVVDVTIA